MKLAKQIFLGAVLRKRYGAGIITWSAFKTLATYPSLGLVYNRIKKNANTTVVILLQEMLSGQIETRGAAKSKVRKYFNLGWRELWKLRRLPIFVIVRNPYSRVLSAFLDKLQHEDYQKMVGPLPLTPSGFQDFIVWLQQGGLKKDGHWNLQSRLLLLPLSAYDFVIRFENLKPEMLAMFGKLGLSCPDDRLDGLYPSDTNKLTSASKRLSEFYTPELAEMVAELYSLDFDCCKYSREFPASLRASDVTAIAAPSYHPQDVLSPPKRG